MRPTRAVSPVVERLVYTSFQAFFAIFALRLVDQRKTVLRRVKWPGERTKPRYLKLPQKGGSITWSDNGVSHGT